MRVKLPEFEILWGAWFVELGVEPFVSWEIFVANSSSNAADAGGGKETELFVTGSAQSQGCVWNRPGIVLITAIPPQAVLVS